MDVGFVYNISSIFWSPVPSLAAARGKKLLLTLGEREVGKKESKRSGDIPKRLALNTRLIRFLLQPKKFIESMT